MTEENVIMDSTIINKGTFNDFLSGCLYTWNRSDLSSDMRLLNALIGMLGEDLEVEYDPNINELGDLLYYVFVFAYEFDGKAMALDTLWTEYVDADNFSSDDFQRSDCQRNLLELIKKKIFHGHTLDDYQIEKIRFAYIEYFQGCLVIINMSPNLSLLDVMRYNQQKLKKRYPKGFSSEDSINRNEK